MSQWLYDSHGIPIVFISGDNVFTKGGRFLGRLDNGEVWHGRYAGEIVRGDRLLYKSGKGSVTRGTPGTPGSPGIPGMPGSKGSISLPSGYSDVKL
jgi:hypothetical protein